MADIQVTFETNLSGPIADEDGKHWSESAYVRVAGRTQLVTVTAPMENGDTAAAQHKARERLLKTAQRMFEQGAQAG